MFQLYEIWFSGDKPSPINEDTFFVDRSEDGLSNR